jgi:hypothetical protein
MTASPQKQGAKARRSWPSGLTALVPSGGSGMPASSDGPIEVILMAFLGGFIGLLLGYMAAQVSRFLSMFVGVSFGGPSWGAYGAIAGALAFALIALAGGE